MASLNRKKAGTEQNSLLGLRGGRDVRRGRVAVSCLPLSPNPLPFAWMGPSLKASGLGDLSKLLDLSRVQNLPQNVLQVLIPALATSQQPRVGKLTQLAGGPTSGSIAPASSTPKSLHSLRPQRPVRTLAPSRAFQRV